MSNGSQSADATSARVETVAKDLEKRLTANLKPDGKLDLNHIKLADPVLGDVLQKYAEAKTWRDDPVVTAREVAKLLEANTHATALGQALQKLSSAIKK